MENVRIDKNGTKYAFTSQGEMMAECQYCSTWFVPSRRFNQRYCCNSCKTMASRHRHGLAGIVSYSDRDKTTNSALKNRINELENKLDKLIDKQNKNMKLDQKELLQKLEVMNTDVRWAKYASVIHVVIGFLKAINDATIDEQVLNSMKGQVNQSEELTGLLNELRQVTDKDSKFAEVLAGLS